MMGPLCITPLPIDAAAAARERRKPLAQRRPRPRPRLTYPAQVYSLAEQNRFYKKAAAGCLRAVAKHSPQLAQAVIDSGSLDALVTCLEEFDPGGWRGLAPCQRCRDQPGARRCHGWQRAHDTIQGAAVAVNAAPPPPMVRAGSR
jgi:hypothetical protein